jgi:serine/threonine protein kinase
LRTTLLFDFRLPPPGSKSDNILIDKHGTAKLADVGNAKILADDHQDWLSADRTEDITSFAKVMMEICTQKGEQ